MNTSAKVTPAERNLISNALGLQSASYQRAITAANKAKDVDLAAHYTKQLDLCNTLILKTNNLELFA